MSQETRSISFIDSCQEEMIALWRCFVNQESSSSDKVGIDRLQQDIGRLLESMGAQVRLIKFPAAGAMLVGELAGGSKKPVVFSGHIDTVFPPGEATKRPFRIDDGKAYGPGVLDMKGGVVVFLYAIKALQAIGFQERPIKILLAGDEEPGHPNSNVPDLFVTEAAGCAAAFNCESGFVDNGIVVGRKAVGYFTIEVQGVACHYGNDPENGRSAIRELSHKVIALEELSDPSKGISVNVGLISGGTVCNAAPTHAQASIDLRCVDEQDMPVMIEKLQILANKQYIAGTKTTITGYFPYPPMKTTESIQELFLLIKDLSKEYGLPEPYTKFCGGGADSAHLVKAGIPTLCGMGVKGGRNHSQDEFALVESLTERAKLLALAVLNLDRFTQV